MKNYWRMKDFSIFSVHYAYVDHSSYQAEDIITEWRVKYRTRRAMMEELSKL